MRRGDTLGLASTLNKFWTPIGRQNASIAGRFGCKCFEELWPGRRDLNPVDNPKKVAESPGHCDAVLKKLKAKTEAEHS
jgi:hypothetical protein